MKTNVTFQTTRSRPRRYEAFTIVELMVVIAIITLLVGITVPTVFAVKNVAKTAATKTLLDTLSQGLDMFKSESNLGRTYPPSKWDTNDGSPYSDDDDNWIAYGAQTLVWGLAGADLLGTPGFPEQVGGKMSTDEDNDGLYALKDGKPLKPRYGPFIDTSKTRLVKPSEVLNQRIVDRLEDKDGNADVPVIVDAFDGPILYFRPDPKEAGLDIYTYKDNDGFLVPHYDTIVGNSEFGKYVKDKRMEGLTTSVGEIAQNADSYLLMSAGADMRFGTIDDVTNFKPNPQD